MQRITIASIFADQDALGGQTVTVCGWARTIRDVKGFGFIELNDGSCFKNLQVVMDANVLDNYKEIAGPERGRRPDRHRHRGAHPRRQAAPGGEGRFYPGGGRFRPRLSPAEEAPQCRVPADHPAPAAPDQPVFRRLPGALRTAHAIHCFFQDRGFVYVHTPIITASDCEGAGEMFQVTTLDLENVPRNEDGTVDYTQDFFGKRANLTVSGQLNCENFAMAFGNVYTFGPTFRAENSNTQRHAAEFWMIEPEMAFADLNDYMDNAEAMIKYVIRYVMDHCPDEIELLQLLCGQGPEGASGARGQLRLRPGQLHRGGGDSEEEQRQV